MTPATDSFNLSFIKRPLLDIPNIKPFENGVNLKIMSYNVLAQALVRRDLFPDNGAALKWKWRHQVLTAEIKHYNPDILLLQEVDDSKVPNFWTPLLNTLGLDSVFYTFPKKPHGSLIAYRASLFSKIDELQINYDHFNDPEMLQLTTTRNTGFAVALEFKSHLNQQKAPGIVVGNSHLFWHPDGSYERARQLGLLSTELEKFGAKFVKWPILLGGDFNSSPDDIPYTFLIKRPKTITEVPTLTLDILKRSVAYLNSVQQDSEAAQRVSIEENTNTLISLYQQISLHDTISLYGEYYRLVHPNNALEADFYEPAFSNWAHSWRGLLDYIFFFKPRSSTDEQLRVLQLLRMPEPAEMGPEPSGQPRESQYPSDHICILATISIC